MKHGRYRCLAIMGVAGAALATTMAGLAGFDYWRVAHPPDACNRRAGWQADAALVLSGAPHLRRTRVAVAAWRAGHVSFVMFSGAGAGGDSAHHLASAARRRLGLPETVTVIEDRARSTDDNLVYSCPLLTQRHVERVALTTDSWHLARALATAHTACPTLAFCGLSDHAPLPDTRHWHETLALLAYQLTGRAALYY